MPKSARKGFTLLEILIVVTIIGIVASMALPKLTASTYDADAGMRSVQSALQQAQRMAIVRQTDVMVSFDTSGRRVRIVFDANNNHQYDAGEEIHWKSLEAGDRFVTPPAGVQMTASAPVVGSNIVSRDGYPTVYFHRDGAISSELELYITSYRNDLSEIRGVHARQATGRVQLYRYNGSTWVAATT